MLRELIISPQRRHQILTLTLAGSLTQLQVLKLRAAVEKETREGARFVILDFNEVTFIDSAGIGTVSSLRGVLEQLSGALVIVRPPRTTIETVLDQSVLSRLIRCFDNQHDAFRYLQETFGGGTNTSFADHTEADALTRKISELENRVIELERRMGAMESERRA